MKIFSLKPVEHTFGVECHSLDDLVAVSRLISPGDLVEGETDRSIKPREEGQKAFRIPMRLTVRVLSVELDESTPSLRVSGTIERGSPAEFVELRAMHSLVFNLFTPIRVQKAQLFSHQIDQLKKAEAESKKPVSLCVVLDDESALLVQVSGAGVKELARIASYKSGKRFASEDTGVKYFSSIAEILFTSPLPQVVIAGPGFTRDHFLSYLKEHTPKNSAKQILSVATNDAGMKWVKEALSSSAITKALGEYSLARDGELVQEILLHLGKDDGLAEYGILPVKNAIQVGAAHTVLISASLLHEQKEVANEMLDEAKRAGITFHVLDEKQEPGQQLAGLGGIAALLRYRTNFN